MWKSGRQEVRIRKWLWLQRVPPMTTLKSAPRQECYLQDIEIESGSAHSLWREWENSGDPTTMGRSRSLLLPFSPRDTSPTILWLGTS